MAVRRALTGPPRATRSRRIGASVRDSDPYGLDLQLALYMCYELHYRGFAGVDPAWEWNPALLALRAELERVFLAGVRRDVGPIEPDDSAPAEMDAIPSNPPTAPARRITCATPERWQQMREYFVHRSLYHLKEGDPHAWAIPRLTGTRQGGFCGDRIRRVRRRQGTRLHQQLFADLLAAADLDSTLSGLPGRSPRRIAWRW